MTAILEYCGHSLKIADFVYIPEDPEPYNCSFDILVKSGLWAGCAVGCECGYIMIKTWIAELEELYEFKRKASALEAGYGNSLLFEINDMGHLAVSGMIYGNKGECRMKFRFQADQTVLRNFTGQLKKMIAEENDR